MVYKMKGFSGFKDSPVKQKVDPDAPGTPGKPGYEPPVKRSDLDAKGKAIWDAHRAKDKPKNKTKLKDLRDNDKNIDLDKGENMPVKTSGFGPRENTNLGNMMGREPEDKA